MTLVALEISTVSLSLSYWLLYNFIRKKSLNQSTTNQRLTGIFPLELRDPKEICRFQSQTFLGNANLACKGKSLCYDFFEKIE